MKPGVNNEREHRDEEAWVKEVKQKREQMFLVIDWKTQKIDLL